MLWKKKLNKWSKSTESLESTFTNAAKARRISSISSEQQARFFEEFVPGCVHPTTGEKLHLYPYQIQALDALFEKQRNLWFWGRQTGKSSTAGLYLAFLSQEIQGDVIIVSFKHERAKEIVKWTRDWCNAHVDDAYHENIEYSAQTHLHFKNGVRIIALPHGESARGYAARIIVMDESQLVPDSDLAAILPTGAATSAKQIFMGTAYGTGGFWWRYIQSADKMGYALSQVRSDEGIIPQGPIIAPQLDSLKLELGEAFYNQECLLIPIPDIDVFFGAELVKSAYTSELHKASNKAELIIGFDHAVSGRDESIAYICTLVGDELREVETRAWLNTLVHEQVTELAGLHPNARYCVDATAEGGKETVGYFQRAGLDVLPIDFSKSKQTIMIHLKNSMQQNLFKFSDQKLHVQLSNYKFAESETIKGKYKFGQKGTPDDRVDAAALANYRAFLLRGSGSATVYFIDQDRIKPGEPSAHFV